MSVSDQEGHELVRAARLAAAEYISKGRRVKLSDDLKARFSFKSGVFVTLNKGKNLRGCIGFPTPERMLHQSLVDAAIAAATEDPRFLPVMPEELDRITFEVTVLTPPAELRVSDPSEYPGMIKVGRDGLIVMWEFGSGLLLPQVPVEYGWDAIEFLNHCCEKAGAPPDCWKKKSTRILRFEGMAFKEARPNGDVGRA